VTDIDDPECVIHCLRHTCATRLLRATRNLVLVRDWLGHTTIQTTASTYAHVETESMLEGARALDRVRNQSVLHASHAGRPEQSASSHAGLPGKRYEVWGSRGVPRCPQRRR
jgi:hypothetical protein